MGNLPTAALGDHWFETAIPPALRDTIQRGTLAGSYRGVHMWKNPLDLALYQRLIWEAKPRTIIEVGTNAGGSALWFADLLGNYGGGGKVITIDINTIDWESVPQGGVPIIVINGDGRNLDEVIDNDRYIVINEGLSPDLIEHPILLVEDADHMPETTAAVLAWWHRNSLPGEYVVIEDGNVEALYPGRCHGGPLPAIRAFLAEHMGEYEVDTGYTDFYGKNATFSPEGYIRRIK